MCGGDLQPQMASSRYQIAYDRVHTFSHLIFKNRKTSDIIYVYMCYVCTVCINYMYVLYICIAGMTLLTMANK